MKCHGILKLILGYLRMGVVITLREACMSKVKCTYSTRSALEIEFFNIKWHDFMFPYDIYIFHFSKIEYPIHTHVVMLYINFFFMLTT